MINVLELPTEVDGGFLFPGAKITVQPPGNRVLVCGGRDFHDVVSLEANLDALHRERHFGLVIHGGASGADNYAGFWAAKRLIPVCVFPANWAFHGNAAGPIRNKSMIQWGLPDLVVAFFGGRGTENMCKQATDAGIEVIRVAR